MKFTIEKNILLEELTNVSKAISTKTIIPILNGIKFELTKDGLYLTASDSELTIKTFIEKKLIKKIENEGTIILQSKYLLDIIRKMPSDIINFEIIDGIKIKIYTENNQYNLNCFDSKEYPSVKLEFNKNPIVLKSSIIKEIINQTCFAVSNQELRPLLTGLNLKISGNIMDCIATDSYRLAKKTIFLEETIKDEIDVVIPGKNLLDLEKIIGDNDDSVEIHTFNNKILFKYKELLFQSNLLSGTYPSTTNLIPNEFAIIIKNAKPSFYDAIDRAALLTQSKDKNIIKLRLDKNIMYLESFASEIGKVEEKLPVELNSDANIDISFSAKYMLEALRTIKAEEILILLNSDVKPIVIKSVTDESLIQLILPIKTY